MILPDEYAWEQLPDESAKAFYAFELYLKAGVERSISKVAQKCRKSVGLINRWSASWQWGERVRRYEAWKQQVKREKLRQRIEESAEDDYETAKKLQEILKSPAIALLQKMKAHQGNDKEINLATFFEMTNTNLLYAAVQSSKVISQLQNAKRDALGVLERMDEEKEEIEESESIQPPSITIIPRAADRDKTERPADVGDV